MTAALTREAIVEAAARAQYMDDRATRGGDGPFEWPEWDDLPDFEQAICRESALVTVLATLTALMPLVEGFEALAKSNEEIAERHLHGDNHGSEMKAYGCAIAYVSAATELRKVMS